MDNLNNIPNSGNWGDAASKLNDNFNKVKQAVTTIENTSKNNKGYFSSLSALNTAFPNPKTGQTAYVYSEASSTKYYIYNAFNGGWVTASVEAPSIGVDISEYTKTGGSAKTTKEVDDDLARLNEYIVSNGHFTKSGYIDSLGEVRWSSVRLHTDFIDISESKEIRVKGVSGPDVTPLAYYDENKIFISAILGSENDAKLITVPKEDFPEGAKYVRSTGSKNSERILDVGLLPKPIEPRIIKNEDALEQLLANNLTLKFKDNETGANIERVRKIIRGISITPDEDNPEATYFISPIARDFNGQSVVRVYRKYMGDIELYDSLILDGDAANGEVQYHITDKFKVLVYWDELEIGEELSGMSKNHDLDESMWKNSHYYINSGIFGIRGYIDATNNKIKLTGKLNIDTSTANQDYNNSNISSSEIGSYIEIPFVGTFVEAYFRTATNRGIYNIYIDNEFMGEVDGYSPTIKYNVKLFKKENLNFGTHILKIELSDKKNDLSSGNSIVFSHVISDMRGMTHDVYSVKESSSFTSTHISKNLFYPQISSKKNANQPIYLDTYDGGNQGLHPKVLYFRNGWNGWKYWLTFSPYKGQNEAIENPCIYVSQNGFDWDVQEGFTNPLDDIQNVAIEYNSDPHLVYNNVNNEIECYWRWVGRGNHPTKPYTEIIYRRTSKDGINWSDKELSFEWNNTENSTRAVISPSIIFEDGIYKMWASHSLDEPGNIRPIGYWESSDAVTWNKIRDIDLGSVVPSHIDVIFWKGKYRMIVFDVKEEGYPYYYCDSVDNISWSTPYRVLERGISGSWDDARLYRPSLCGVDGWMRLYYSAYSSYGTNYVGLIIFDDFESLKIE